MVKAGADIIIGCHPHMIHGIEIYQGALICYSLGNLTFDNQSSSEFTSTILIRIVASNVNGHLVKKYEALPLEQNHSKKVLKKPALKMKN